MNIQTFVNTRYGTGAGVTLSRWLSPPLGYACGQFLADLAATRRRSHWLRAVRANQWVASGKRRTATQLDAMAQAVLRHQARCLFDLYHTRRDPAAMQRLAPPTRAMNALIERSRSGTDGAMIVIPHLSNFDLAFIANSYRGFRAQMLTFSHPTGGYRLQNRIRAVEGFDITPVSEEATRQAIERMKQGGLVLTAVDRPISGKKHLLNFFGYPSPMPAGHVRMAMAAGVPVIVAAVVMSRSGAYEIVMSDPIPMRPADDPVTATRQNAQAVLDVVADFIAQAPDQWLMYYPVWPEALEEMPQLS